MTLLRLSLLCFVLAAMGVLFVPFAVAKLLAGVFAVPPTIVPKQRETPWRVAPKVPP